MPRVRAPLWLTAPTRYAGLLRARARWIVAALALFIALALTALAVPDPTDPTPGQAATASDLGMYETVIAGLRGGGDYYTLTAEALRAGSYPLKPFLTFRLPVHAVVQAALPPLVPRVLLVLLTIGVAVAWWRRIAPQLARPSARILLTVLLAAGLMAFVQADLVAFHEIWAALLVALALALRTPERWVPSIALGLIAMLARETAALLPLVMAAFAWREGARREAAGWGLSLLALFAAIVAHAWAVAQVVGPLDPASPGWSGLLGPGFFVRAFASSTALDALPLMIAAPLVALALFGWTAWRDSVAPRAAALFAGYAAAIAIFARADTFYWALMPAPVLLVGLVFFPDALRDLAATLLDRRRIRVQRITQ
ncbi:hypothetical protein [uncultured Sphingomonas sp.]|uniref:hypothetical protein n=1 Tax=uncultured Sphingomonas sp. TaxID=158754 RepID=UPI003747F47D